MYATEKRIALCFGLTTCLFSLFESLDRMMLSQFENHQKYDIKIMLNEATSKDEIEDMLEKYEYVVKYEVMLEVGIELEVNDESKQVMVS